MAEHAAERCPPVSGGTLPSFLGVGVQRAATTWVHHCLAEHPEVFVPAEKELAFFSENYRRGRCWYEACFAGSDGARAIGEITPTYLHDDQAIERIAGLIPQARLFVIVREPVERALSAYRLLRTGRFKGMSFAEAVEKRRNLVELGLYARPLRELYRWFPRDQVAVFLYDDLTADPRAFLRALYGFLGVDTQVVPASVRDRYNAVRLPRLQGLLEGIGLGGAVAGVKRSPLGRRLVGWRTARLAASERRRNRGGELEWLRERFRGDVMEVQALIGRDLSAWL